MAVQILDYDDPGFDPFATYDRSVGLFEVDDPYPRLHELRSAGSVHSGDIRQVFGLEPFPFWRQHDSFMIFGFEPASSAMLNARNFSNQLSRAMYEGAFGESINAMDAPEHLRYRTLFQQAFLPQPMRAWGVDVIPRVVSAIIDSFRQRGSADLVKDFTLRYPFEVLYAQLGLPQEDLTNFRRLSSGLMCVFSDFAHANEASRKMGAYFARLIDERRGGDGVDLISVLANAEIDGERLPDEIVISFLRQLLNAAGDTTYRATGNLLVGLLTHPQQFDAVRQNAGMIPQAIEEALRWECPLPTLLRQTTADVEIRGVRIPKGAKVDIIVGSANRDPARYEQPDHFNIYRPPARHLTFASGPHICLGQHLVRIEMECAIRLLFEALPNLRPNPHEPRPQVVGLHARTPPSLPVLFDPR